MDDCIAVFTELVRRSVLNQELCCTKAHLVDVLLTIFPRLINQASDSRVSKADTDCVFLLPGEMHPHKQFFTQRQQVLFAFIYFHYFYYYNVTISVDLFIDLTAGMYAAILRRLPQYYMHQLLKT